MLMEHSIKVNKQTKKSTWFECPMKTFLDITISIIILALHYQQRRIYLVLGGKTIMDFQPCVLGYKNDEEMSYTPRKEKIWQSKQVRNLQWSSLDNEVKVYVGQSQHTCLKIGRLVRKDF